jgi:hypothetical protein
MKYILLSGLILVITYCKQNKTSNIKNKTEIKGKSQDFQLFKTINYNSNKSFEATYDTVKSTGTKIDIYYFQKHFNHPYHLPSSLTSSQYKDTVITVWSKPPSKENYTSNWSHTYTYDSLGRVINYTYSSCIVCSSFYFDCILTYDESGRVNSIRNVVNEEESYKIYYNEAGDIKQLYEYSSGERKMSISLIN